MVFLLAAALSSALGAPARDVATHLAGDCGQLQSVAAAVAAPNDNRQRAGTLREGVLTVRLVARAAAWKPEGPTGCALPVNAFAEEGRGTQVPGPLLRVQAGTQVHVSVRNALAVPIWVRGFQDRTAGTPLDSSRIAAGASRTFDFVPKAPGAWIYWANRTGSQQIAGDADGQLVGAMVVDSVTPSPPAVPQRILVLTRWKSNGTSFNDGYQLNAFNGLSWPHSERLRYTVDDSVRWHVLNATNAVHEMHLHGFFYRLEAREYSIDTVRASDGQADMRVTAVLRAGEWMTIAWKPDRPGNWIFHCHVLAHMSGEQRLERLTGAVMQAGHDRRAGAHANDDHHDMAGLVVAIRVDPKRGSANMGAAAPVADASRRIIDLYADARPRTFGEKDGYGFVMQEGRSIPARDSIRIPGSPLVLTRGEPVRITVHNRLRQPISVHWHGIELESYNDGVGGISGDAAHIARSIAPEDSFVVRMTPPRSGTYMYHVHSETGDELASGLYGSLLVVEAGAPIDSRTDRAFVLSDGGPGPSNPFFVNGSAAPDTMEMVAGTTYRLRMMYITSNNVVTTTLRGPAGPLRVRRLAQDGYDQRSAQSFPLRLAAGPGHTFDYEFTPTEPGMLWLDFGYAANTGVTNVPATTLPIRVRAP